MRGWKRNLALWIARNRRRPVGRLTGTVSSSLFRAYENDNSDGHTNGEHRLLESLPATSVSTVFDVGAHHGSWALHAASALAGATVHAFEILPTTRAELAEQVRHEDRVVVAPFGLADRSGDVSVYVDPRYPMTTSITPAEPEREIVPCPVETGDAYFETLGADRLDVLKIDAEGADLAVLRGFTRALQRSQIGLIQFEFTLWAAIARVWLADFYDLLEPAGFTIGKIFPTFVDWRPYRPEDEIFVRANFVAVHEDRDDFRRALAVPLP